MKPNNNQIKAPEHIIDGDKAIICDIDGTLALFEGDPYDRDFSTDKLNEPICDILTQYSRSFFPPRIILFSGRKGEHMAETKDWLYRHAVPYNELYMISPGDTRKDTIVKREMYEAHVRGKYNVLFVLDDRNQVVQQWRELGLTCLQVAPGDF